MSKECLETASCKRFHKEEAEVRTGREAAQYLVAIGKLGLELRIAIEIPRREGQGGCLALAEIRVRGERAMTSFCDTVKQNVA